MADCSVVLSKAIPELVDDIQAQIGMFESLYNMNETIVFSDETLVEWTKQKERRKGFAKFVTELYTRNLVSEEVVQKGLDEVVHELQKSSQLTKSEQNDENIHQFAVFLFETAKLIPKTDETIRNSLKNLLSEFLTSAKVQMKTKYLVKSDSEYTSTISGVFKCETCFIVETENSLYIVSADIPVKRITQS
jgi:hypothetical protein